MEKAKKKRVQKYVSWGCAALVVLALAVMPLMASSAEEASGPQASILSGTVRSGSLSMALHGGGTLTDGDAEDVILPSGVKITEFLVKNGDVVTEGTPLASVDSVSVLNAMAQVQETLQYLQEEMEDVQNEKAASSVRAKAGGRVKAVYAQAGDDVQTVMLEHGALAVLSLDGLMAVALETTGVTTGDAVQVTLSDGGSVTGRVESCLNGVAVITVEDEGYAVGENVTVKTQYGSLVGSGALYIHNAWKATAFTGTVSTVWAREEATVSSGASLFTLTGTEYTAQLESLAAQHRKYEQQLQDLSRMYQEGTINAPCGGRISGLDEDSPFLLAAEEAPLQASPLANTDTGWTILLLSNVEEEESPTESPVVSDVCTGYAGIVTGVGIDGLLLSVNDTPYTVTRTEDGLWDLSQVNLDTALMLERNIPYTTSETGEYALNDIVVLIYDETGSFLALVTAQKAEPEPAPTDPAAPPEVSEPTGETDPTFPGGGDLSGLEGLIGGSGMGGTGGMGGMSGMGGGAAAEPEVELYDLEGSVLMTVTDQNAMTLTITVDEQDISRVSAGQIAEVEVAALRGQAFEAEVTRVAISGTNSGGSSKFTVELTMDKAENMLAGMSATASIPLYTKMDVLTIPVAALTEQGASTVLYTALDEETGAPTAPVEVTVGISDGETAELLSGLNSGDSYYYYYYDTLELSEKVESASYSFGRNNK
ncbi:MAG: HlyD family efflux transporter periplasmic adaptor subunit [Evtepia sp.]